MSKENECPVVVVVWLSTIKRRAWRECQACILVDGLLDNSPVAALIPGCLGAGIWAIGPL